MNVDGTMFFLFFPSVFLRATEASNITTLQLHDPKKCELKFFYLIHTVNTLILMIKKRPLIVSELDIK
jgi:hypothetical protein